MRDLVPESKRYTAAVRVVVRLPQVDGPHAAMNLESLAEGSQANTNVVYCLLSMVYRAWLVTGADGWKSRLTPGGGT